MRPDAILDELPIGVWVGRAPSGTAAYVNATFAKIMGMGMVAEAPIGEAPAVYGITDRSGAAYPVEKLPFSRALAAGAPVVVDDIVIVRPDGSKVDVRCFATPVRAEGGEIEFVIVAFIDITREVAAERARDTLHTHLELAINHTPMGIFAIDSQGNITLSEGAALDRLGVKPGELVGEQVFDVYRDHPTVPDYLRRGLAGEAFWYSVEVNGAVFDTWITPDLDANGAVRGVVGVFTDVTEERRLQRNAVHHDRIRALGTLAASIAHEINNPLTWVGGHMEEIADHVDSLRAEVVAAGLAPEVAARLLHRAEQIQTCVGPVNIGFDRITRITRQLGAFSRASDSRSEPVDLSAALDAALELAGKETRSRADIQVDLHHSRPVLTDEVRLVQVILNLLINARQAVTTARGLIRVRSVDDDTRFGVWLEIEDDGPGIPEELRERVFESFFTTKEPGVGTGLGLFVCRTIVDQLGGTIEARAGVSGGALLRVWLPAAVPIEPTPEPAGARVEAGPARVLVIDDDPFVLESLKAPLARSGMHVQVVGNGEDALALLRADPDVFDVIYCDLMMKGMTGMDLQRRLAADFPNLPGDVYFMTGGAYTEEAQAFVAAQGERCLSKPFDILATTRRAVAHRRKLQV